MARTRTTSRRPATFRQRAVARLRAQLLRQGWPRLQMSLIVTLTGAAGLLASWALQARVPEMALRYPLAVGVAYLAFFVLLWVWLRSGHEDWSQVNFDLGGGPGHGPGRAGLDASAGAGGSSGSDTSWLDAADAGDAWPVVLVVLLAVALLGVLALMAGVVWSAPVLFAELLFDGVLAAGLYRHLRQEDVLHWSVAALRRTALPFGAAAVLAALVGALLAWLAPGATTLGQALGG